MPQKAAADELNVHGDCVARIATAEKTNVKRSQFNAIRDQTMNVIPYSDVYREQVMELILHIQANEFEIPITANDQPDLQNIDSYYQKGLGNFWVAVINDHVVGTVSLLDIGQSFVALRKMFVAKDYRGAEFGVAKKLLGCLLNWAKEKKIKVIYLGTTSKFLAAHRFYEKNGFMEVSKYELPKSFPIMAVDTKFYKYNI